MRYLISINATSHNIILADSQAMADHCAALVGGVARLLADDERVELSAPEPIRETAISKSAWLKRFTQAERIGIRTLAKANPVVEDFLELLNAAPDVVHLDDPDMVAGVPQVMAALESTGVIEKGQAASRAAVILA